MPWKPTYASVQELALYVRIDDTVDDVQLGFALEAASRAVDVACHRQFGQATASRVYTPRLDPSRHGVTTVRTDDLVSVTAVDVDTDGYGTFATPLPGWSLRPYNAPANGLPYTQVATVPSPTAVQGMPLRVDSVRVTGLYGWPSVPGAVKQATLLQASRLLARRNAPFGIAGSPDAGSEMRLLAKIDPDVQVMLTHYVRYDLGFA